MVNIIMPAYNAHDTIRQSISSICMQDDLDNIMLTIVDDCSDENYDYLYDEFQYLNLKILRKEENSGCGQSRQFGVDCCESKYFMFLDADDCLYSPNSVKKLYSSIEAEELDFIYSDFAEELENGEYLLHERDGIWMHGKIFRTEYIKNNNIRFNETRYNEDHAYNVIVRTAGGRNRYIDYVTYIWKWNKNSITRTGNYLFDKIDSFIMNAEYTVTEVNKLNIGESEFLKLIKSYLLTFYAYYNRMIFSRMTDEYISKYINDIRRFYSNIPLDLSAKISLEFLSQELHHHPVIAENFEKNILFNIRFCDYYNMIEKVA